MLAGSYRVTVAAPLTNLDLTQPSISLGTFYSRLGVQDDPVSPVHQRPHQYLHQCRWLGRWQDLLVEASLMSLQMYEQRGEKKRM